MLRTIGAAMIAAATAGGAAAQTTTPGIPLVPLGFCQLSPSTVKTLSACGGAWNNGAGGIPAGANAAVIRTESQASRYRDDGVAPSSTVGQPILTSDPPLFYEGTLSAFQVIQEQSGATVDVLFYKVPAQ